jgi:acyl-CoA thioesterase-1
MVMKKVLISSLAVLVIITGYLILSSSPEIGNFTPAGENIICFGDSLTHGTGASAEMDYPSQLSKMIGRDVINAGIPGDTTKDALERLKTDVLLKSPRIVLITLGGNDLKNKVPKDVAFANLKTIIEAIQDTGALVIIGGIDIPLFGRGFDREYARVCDLTGAILIPNIYEHIFGHQNLMSDPIHPNDRGYQVMAERFYEAMKPYL